MQIRTREGYEHRSANPYLPWGSTAPPPPGGISDAIGGVQINEHNALQLAAVWGSVSLIADSIATLPIQQWCLPRGSNDPVEAKRIDPAPVIAQPWSEFDQRDFITQGSMSMLLQGNVWGRKLGLDDMGLPTQVQLVHPDHARIRRDDEGQLEVRYWGQPVSWELVTRKMALSGPEGIQGLSPIGYLRNAMGLARAQDLWANAFYANSAVPNGVIQVPGDLEDDQTKAMLSSWLASHQGINKRGLPAILTGGAEWKPVTISLADLQFLAQMQFSEGVISGRIYRIPPHMLGMQDKDTSWGSGIEQQELGFVRNTLLIWLCRWEDLMTSWLPPRQFVTFDLSQRLRGDTLQRFQAYQIARICGFMNNLDVMRAEGMAIPTDPELLTKLGDYAAPLNSSPLKVSGGEGPGGDKAN